MYSSASVAGNWEYFFQTNSPECNSFQFTLVTGASDIDEAVVRFGTVDGGNNMENQNVYGAGYEAFSARIKSTGGSVLGQNVYGSATVPDGSMSANGIENHDIHVDMQMNSSLGPGTYVFEMCVKFQDGVNARLKANNNDGYATSQNGTMPYFALYGTAAATNGVAFTYPEADSTIGTKWRYEWNYQTTSTRAVRFEILTCPYLTSCANNFVVPATFMSGTSTHQGTALVLTPMSPGNKQSLITMYDQASGASLGTDEVFFTVSNAAGSNTSSTGPFSTSTVDSSPVHCEINLPDLVFGDDSSVDPCALVWWLVVPSGDLLDAYLGSMHAALNEREPYHSVVSVFGTITDTSISTTTKPTLSIPNPFGTTSTPDIAIISSSTWSFTESTNYGNVRAIATAALVIAWVFALFIGIINLFKSD